jgi:hypothetical protein
MDKFNAEMIHLVSIADKQLADGRGGKAITLRYESHTGDSLTAAFVVAEDQVRDEALVSVARDWLHKTCRDIAHATENWALNYAQLREAEGRHNNSPADRAPEKCLPRLIV